MKKHNCLLLILVIACCGVARAQVETTPATEGPAASQTPPAKPHHPSQNRWSFDLLGGPAIPTGRFAHTDEQNPKSGLVQTGSVFELSGTYHLSSHWGIVLLANRQHDKSDVDDAIVPISFGNPPIPAASAPGPLVSGAVYTPFGPQHWTMTRILAGGVYTLPLNAKKNFALLVRALAGVQKTHTSVYSYSLQVQNMTSSSDFSPRNLPWAFSYQADAGVKWKLDRRWSLLALAGYNGCRPSYNQNIADMLTSLGLPATTAGGPIKRLYFPTGSILLRAGVGFDL